MTPLEAQARALTEAMFNTPDTCNEEGVLVATDLAVQALRQVERETWAAAAGVARDPTMLAMAGGSTGNAWDTQTRIVNALRAKAKEVM